MLTQMVGPFICFQKPFGVCQILFWDPFVTSGGVSFPGHEITSALSCSFVGEDSLYFIFFFVIDKVRWWFSEIRTVNLCFLIG